MEQSTRSRILDMTKGNVLHLLLCFALPLFLGNLLQQVYNLADTSIAGHMLGDNALAQIGATSALYSLITNFAFGMNNGLALTASSLLCRKQLMDLLQVPAGTSEGALSYLMVILAGIPLTMIYNLESALLQAVGNSVTPLVLLLFSSVLNVGLDFLFMGPLGIGVRGAAIATVLAQGVSAGLGFLYIWKNYQSTVCFLNVYHRTEHGIDECNLQHRKCSIAEQYQCFGEYIYFRTGRRQETGRTFPYARFGAGDQCGNLHKSESWGRGKETDRPGNVDRKFFVCGLVDHSAVFYFYSSTCNSQDNYRKQ